MSMCNYIKNGAHLCKSLNKNKLDIAHHNNLFIQTQNFSNFIGLKHDDKSAKAMLPIMPSVHFHLNKRYQILQPSKDAVN